MNSDYQQQYNLSVFINTVRDFLKKQGYFEHHLYSTLNYKIENTDTFKIKDNLYLRYNPEPDIWQVGIKHDKLFWIGSMFRDEDKLDDLHQYEFTVIDIYQARGTVDMVIKYYIEILKTLEKELKLSPLSELKIKYMTHKDFSVLDKNDLKGKYWLIVTDYSVDESFYDVGRNNSLTSKFEIFFMEDRNFTEIVACGNLGDNLNQNNFVSNGQTFINQDLLEKSFIGFGIGLERLMRLYNR